MPVRVLLLIMMVISYHYHNSGPEKMGMVRNPETQNPDRPKSRQILDFVIHRPVDALLHVKSRDHVIYKIYLNICIEKMSQLYFFLTVIFIF